MTSPLPTIGDVPVESGRGLRHGSRPSGRAPAGLDASRFDPRAARVSENPAITFHPRGIKLIVDQQHVERVRVARRQLCIGEDVAA